MEPWCQSGQRPPLTFPPSTQRSAVNTHCSLSPPAEPERGAALCRPQSHGACSSRLSVTRALCRPPSQCHPFLVPDNGPAPQVWAGLTSAADPPEGSGWATSTAFPRRDHVDHRNTDLWGANETSIISQSTRLGGGEGEGKERGGEEGRRGREEEGEGDSYRATLSLLGNI